MFRSRNFLVLFFVVLCSFFLFSCGGGNSPLSDGQEIIPEAQLEASELLETQNSAKDFYKELEAEGDSDALQKTVGFLEEQDNVEEAAVGEDGVSIWVRYLNGTEAIILTESFGSLDLGSFPRLKMNESLSSNSYRLLARENGKKAIILLPIDSMPNYQDESVDDIELSLRQSGYSVEIYRNQDVTVDLMRTVSNYDFIYMVTHGGIGPWGNVHIATGEIAHFNATAKLWSYLISVTSGITIFSYRDDDNLYFGLNSHFFDDYSYPESFIYMNACSSLKRDNLADAFLDNGASIYVGWDNISFLALSNFHNPRFFSQFAEPGNTFKDVYNLVFTTYYPCSVFEDDNKNGNYHVLFYNGFEAGDIGDITFDYTLNLKYKGNPDFVLNVQNSPPIVSDVSASGAGIGGGGTGNIEISYNLFDADDDSCGITVEYLSDLAGATWEQASITGAVSGIISGLGSVIWHSSSDEYGASANYQIRITPQDSDNTGIAGFSSLFFVDNLLALANTPPVASIISPLTDSNFVEGSEIVFSGTGTDAEDGDLSGSSLVWISNISGQIGIGESFSANSLPVGIHTISLTVTDSGSITDSDFINIAIAELPMPEPEPEPPANTPPVASIDSPLTDSNFIEGGTITFIGTGTDFEDGDLSGSSLVWTSNISGQIGTGESFSANSLPVGIHTISLTVTDSNGATGNNSIIITINVLLPPEPFDVMPWAMHRHNAQQTGQSSYLGPQTGAIKWTSYRSKGYFSKIVVDNKGTIFVGESDVYDEENGYENNLCAFNAADGSLKWKFPFRGYIFGLAINNAGNIYLASGNFFIDCFYIINPDGSLKWRDNRGFDSNLIIGSDGRVYGGLGNSLKVVDPNGTFEWSFMTEGRVCEPPALGLDGTIYVGSQDGNLYALKHDGDLKWKFATNKHLQGYSIRISVNSEGTIYLGTADYLYAVNPDGSLKWKNFIGEISGGSCEYLAVSSNGVYIVKTLFPYVNNYLYCFNHEDGTLRWKYQLNLEHTCFFEGLVIDKNSDIYFGSCFFGNIEGGEIIALNADGTLKWTVSNAKNGFTSMAIGMDGVIYCATFFQYYCNSSQIRYMSEIYAFGN